MIKNNFYGIIYKITNLVNGKIYIGQTRQSLRVRWNSHKSHSKKNTTVIARAIRKYGHENFSIEIIDTAINENELNEKEGKYIALYQACDRNIGYNITPIENGKRGISEFERIKLSMIAKERFSKEGSIVARGTKVIKNYTNFVGVTLVSSSGNWRSCIGLNNKRIHIGMYYTEEEAAKAYDIEALKLYGVSAKLNFPDLKEAYLDNKIIVNRIGKKSDSKIIGIYFSVKQNKWRFCKKGYICKSFNTKEDAESYVLKGIFTPKL